MPCHSQIGSHWQGTTPDSPLIAAAPGRICSQLRRIECAFFPLAAVQGKDCAMNLALIAGSVVCSVWLGWYCNDDHYHL